MRLCDESTSTQEPDTALLTHALVEAQRYSDEFYGPDCYVCAELLPAEPRNLSLHITSPFDLLLNTSAVITVRRSDGKVLRKGAYHSCHARTTSRAADA